MKKSTLKNKILSFALSTALATILVIGGTTLAFADESHTINNSSYQSLQSYYNANKTAMDSSNEWQFGKRQINVGTSNNSDPEFEIPSNITSIKGYGDETEGTVLNPYYYNNNSLTIKTANNSSTTLDNLYFNKDNNGYTVKLKTVDNSNTTVKNSVFEGPITISSGSTLNLTNSEIYAAMTNNGGNLFIDNSKFGNLNSGAKLEISTNRLDNGTVGTAYSSTINFNKSLATNNASSIQLDPTQAVVNTNIAGLTARLIDNGNGSYSVVIEGTPTAELTNGIVNVALVYGNAANGGFSFNIPYYVNIAAAQPSPVTPVNPVVNPTNPVVNPSNPASPSNNAASPSTTNISSQSIKTSAPNTGDSNNMPIAISVVIMSGLAMATLIYSRRRTSNLNK